MIECRSQCGERRSSAAVLCNKIFFFSVLLAVGWLEIEKTLSSGELDKCVSLANDARVYLCVFSYC